MINSISPITRIANEQYLKTQHLAETSNFDSTQQSQLRPCPFCGGIPHIKESNDIPAYYGVDHYCGYDRRIHIELKWKPTKAEVIKSWNKRSKV